MGVGIFFSFSFPSPYSLNILSRSVILDPSLITNLCVKGGWDSTLFCSSAAVLGLSARVSERTRGTRIRTTSPISVTLFPRFELFLHLLLKEVGHLSRSNYRTAVEEANSAWGGNDVFSGGRLRNGGRRWGGCTHCRSRSSRFRNPRCHRSCHRSQS